MAATTAKAGALACADDDSEDDAEADSEPPTLLIVLDAEPSTVALLLQLRRDLLALIDRLVGAAGLGSALPVVAEAFSAVRDLLTESHARQSTDPSRAAQTELQPVAAAEAEALNLDRSTGCAIAECAHEQRRYDPFDSGYPAGRGSRKGMGRGGGYSGYPWWTHLPSYRRKGKK